jgi:transcriptional regulator with XRE-family HTH domain
MANKKEINTKSGERLRELIQSLKMTYADFGESVNLSERTINAYVTCARRLTEDSARIIARKYPVVRYEWLMGWDDYKTESEVIEAKLFIESEKICRDELEWIDRAFKVGQILRCWKCDLEPMFVIEEEIKDEQLLNLPSVSKEKKFREICELISSDEYMFLYDYFSAQTADEIYQKIKEIKNQNELPIIAENNVSIKSVIHQAILNTVLGLVGCEISEEQK